MEAGGLAEEGMGEGNQVETDKKCSPAGFTAAEMSGTHAPSSQQLSSA